LSLVLDLIGKSLSTLNRLAILDSETGSVQATGPISSSGRPSHRQCEPAARPASSRRARWTLQRWELYYRCCRL